MTEGKATERERDRLGLQANDTVYRVRRVRLHKRPPVHDRGDHLSGRRCSPA